MRANRSTLERKQNGFVSARSSKEFVMKIAGCHSHLNGLEFLQVHKPALWDEIKDAIVASEPSRESHYAPVSVKDAIKDSFQSRNWNAAQLSAESASDAKHILKDRIGIALQFGPSGVGPYDAFAKHMAFYVGDVIDVGIEILPMKELQAQMSSGVAYYEGELYNLIHEGRGVPAVPLVLIGVAS
jgi:hypothetical protein